MHTHLHANQLNKGFNAFVETMNCGRVMRRRSYVSLLLLFLYLYVHFYCSVCTFYLGKDRTRRDCQNCSEPFVGENSMKNGSFFLYVPLQRQLKNLLMDTEIHAKLTNRNLQNITQSSIISDVTSSMLYRQLIQHHHLSCNDISITWNADGVPIFKSSKYSIWPIQCMVNELPPSTVKECSAYRSVVWPQQT